MSSLRDRYRAARAGWKNAGGEPGRPQPGPKRSDVHAGRHPRPSAKATAPDRWQRGTAIGGLASVLLVAVGLYLTNDYNRDQYGLQQDSLEKQQELALNGQRADRFVKAIDQLGEEGEEKLGIRLGGIYALETLMRESADDENTIIEVLCAFVRTHAARPEMWPKDGIPGSSFDVRAALTVLGRRPDPKAHTYLDFTNTLFGLRRIDLRRADLSGSELIGADLGDANLNHASLRGADLLAADLAGADLASTDLRDANLARADLTRANLRGANLLAANLRGADLTDANLGDVYLGCTKMDESTKLPPEVARSDSAALRRPECQQ